MGRPKKDPLSKRSKELRLRLTDTEYFWIKEVAEEHHTNMSAILRATFFEYIRQNFSNDDIAKVVVKVVGDLKFQYSRK